MGRFYRTASANPLDYMHKLNLPLMERVINSNDQSISEQLNQTNQYKTLGTSFPGLSDDEQAMKERSDYYTKKSDDIVNSILNDPTNWRSKQSAIQDLSRELQEDYKRGPISKWGANYNTVKSKFDEIDELAKEYQKSGKGIRPEDADRFKKDMLAKWKNKTQGKGTNYDAKTGQYNTVDVYTPSNYIDLHKTLDEEAGKIVKDKNVKEFSQFLGNPQNGEQPYFDDVKGSWIGIPQDKILGVAMARLQDPDIQRYLSQYSDAGVIQGYKDSNGNVISPFKVNKNDTFTDDEVATKDKMQLQINRLRQKGSIDEADEKQKELDDFVRGIKSRTKVDWDNNSFLSPMLQGIIQKYSGTEVENSNKLRANSIYTSKAQIAAANWRTSYTQGKLDDRQKVGIEAAKDAASLARQNELDKITLAASLKANNGKGAANSTNKTVNTSSILSQGYEVPYSVLGTDKNKVLENLDFASKANQQEIQQLYSQLDKTKNPEITNLIKSQIQQVQTKQSLLGNKASAALEDAKKAVFSDPNDESLYYFKEQAKKDYNTLIGKFHDPDVVTRLYEKGKMTGYVDREGHQIAISKDEQANAKKIIANYKKSIELEKRVNDKYSENLVRATSEKTNGRVIVETTNNADNIIRKTWDSDGEAFHLLNPKTGEVDKKAGLIDPYDKDLKIIGAGPAGGADGNNDMTISVKYKGQDYDIHVTGQTGNILKSHILDDWSKTGKDDAKAVAEAMRNPYYETINSVLNESIGKTNDGVGTVGEDIPTIISTPTGNQQIRITPISSGDTWNSPKYRLKMETNNGFETIKDFSSGWEIANYLKTIFPNKK